MEIEREILARLLRDHIIGGKHTDITHLCKGFPSHLRGEAKQVAYRLLKEGILIPKSTSYGFHVSLDPARLEEVRKRIGK